MSSRPAQLLLQRIRRRAQVQLLARDASLLAIAALGLLTVFGVLGGAIPSRLTRVLFWSSSAICVAAIAWRFVRDWIALRGPRVARLVSGQDPQLASRLQSLAEFEQESHRHQHSSSLLAAHLAQTDQRSAHQVSNQLMPWPRQTLRLGSGSAAVAVVVLLWAGLSLEQRTAMLNLLTSGTGAGAASDLSGHIVTQVNARIVFPAYLKREPTKVRGPRALELPVGTYLDFEVATIEGAEEVFAASDENVVALTQAESGQWRGRWVVRKGEQLNFRATINGETWRDRDSLALIVENDAPPELRAEHLSGGESIDDPIHLHVFAEDDFGLSNIHLVLRGVDGQQTRRPLMKSNSERRRRFDTEISISPSEVGAIEGDTIEIWAEAHDNDDVSGPKVGTSNRLALRIGKPADETAAWLEALMHAFEAALGALADTLEDISAKKSLARTEEALRNAQKGTPPKEVKVTAQALRGKLRSPTIETLEEVVLEIQKLIASQQRLAAAAVMREIESLRQQMDALVERLISSRNPQTQRELLATLRRLQNKMAEMNSKLTTMGVSAPQDFSNPGRGRSESPQAQESTFEKVKAALEAENYEALQRHLIELRRSLDGMAESLQKADDIAASGASGGSSQQQRAERLMSEFLDRINAAEVTERTIMRDSQRIAGLAEARALLRATSATGLAPEKLEKQLDAQREGLRKLANKLSSETGDERASELAEEIEGQLGEVRAALDADRYFEALDLLQRAEYKSDQLHRDLRVNALMFPGRDSAARELATEAGKLRERVQGSADALRKGIPNPGNHIDAADRKGIRQAQQDQSKLEESMAGLSDEIDAHLPGLGQQINPLLERARQHMRASKDALDAQQLRRSVEAQRSVLRELEEIRMVTQNARSGGGGGESEAEASERVVIPGEGKRGGDDRRRKIIDGMRQDRLPGFEHETGAYFEELLR